MRVIRARPGTAEETVIQLAAGDLYIGSYGDRVDTTLGSCIAACVYDDVAGLGGMNHFLLPSTSDDQPSIVSDTSRFGNQAMELLINALLKRGAIRRRLKVKFFGGADMLGHENAIGHQNIEFVRAFAAEENFGIESEDLGGDRARMVRFWPHSGRALVRCVGTSRSLQREEAQHLQSVLAHQRDEGDIELF